MNNLNRFRQLLNEDVISRTEFEFVRFLSTLDSEASEDVLLAAAACVQAQLNGHVCLDLRHFENSGRAFLFNDEKSGISLNSELRHKWENGFSNSGLVSTDGELQPLVLENGRLYLHRFWKYEHELADWIKAKSAGTHLLKEDDLQVIHNFVSPTGGAETDWQKVALGLSFLKDLVVISGGPGTGKTHTVLNIIAAHDMRRQGERFKVALAAPTGKAARRLMESLQSGKTNLPEHIKQVEIPDTALTVHKLLGSDFQGTGFRYNAKNKLPYDLVIIDEASMLDITMWVHLIRAIPDHAKLIVLGDKDQLASVEAGSILGDICGGENSFSTEVCTSMQKATGFILSEAHGVPSINDSVVFLTKSYRFNEKSGIQQLATAINESDADKVLDLLQSDEYPDLQWMEPGNASVDHVIQEFAVKHFQEFKKAEVSERLAASNRKKILCALRKGRFGADQINRLCEKNIREHIQIDEEWYDSRIVMAKRNDAVLRVKNGEIGICNRYNEEALVDFEGENNMPFSAFRLKDYEAAYALTIHKSQGSEFDKVAIILPERVNSITSKEILYTSVTRARSSTLVIGKRDVIRHTVLHPITRSSGLHDHIWGS